MKKTVRTIKPSAAKPSAKKSPAPKVQPKAPAKAQAQPAASPAPVSPASPVEGSVPVALESLRQEVTALRSQLAKTLAPVSTGTMEEVDALRRVLNDLMESRLNEVIRELVSIRNQAASSGPDARLVTEQMDTLLADLGAQKFEAERLEHVDPLIHTITRETNQAALPDGVIVETIRPGFHTGRGLVVAKALVTVNRRN